MTTFTRSYFIELERLMNWDKFSEIYDWEFDLLTDNHRQEINFWIQISETYGSPILEIACGSGRITLPLLENGFQITAIDISEKMLTILKSKTKKDSALIIQQGDMRDFSIDKKFPVSLITYASFQLLLTEKDQITCLKNINHHLEKNGILIIDTHYRLCEDPQNVSKTKLYKAYNNNLQSHITMFTSYTTDKINNIRSWDDLYVLDNDTENSEFHNFLALKDISPNLMNKIANISGFDIIDIYGDFDQTVLNDYSDKAIYLLRKRD